MIPNSLYKFLPYFYLAIALFLILFFDDFFRWIPAAFFIASAGMVMWWRWQNQRKQ